MFFVALFVFLVAVAAVVIGMCSDYPGEKFALAGVLVVAGFVLTIVSSMSIVPTRNVGIVTSFGKPTGKTTGAGLVWSAPWQDVDDWDASGQTYAHLGDKCVWVTVKGPRSVCIPVQVEWSALPGKAPENWAAFKAADDMSRFETWVSRRVNPQFNAALISAFATFDPFAGANPKTGEVPVPDLNASYKSKLSDALAETLGADIAIRSIAFGTPVYDEATTNSLAEYSSKALAGRNLELDYANALKRKAVTDVDSKADPVARCLSIAERSGKEPGFCLGAGVSLTRSVD